MDLWTEKSIYFPCHLVWSFLERQTGLPQYPKPTLSIYDVCDECADGFALVATLLLMLLVSGILASFSVVVWTNRSIYANVVQLERIDILADGMLRLLAEQLPEKHSSIATNSVSIACTTTHSVIRIKVQGQSGLVDLNAGDRAVLAAAFISLGFDGNAADGLAASVEAFRAGNMASFAVIPKAR